MSEQSRVETIFSGQASEVIAGMMELSVVVRVKFAMPAQDNRLPAVVEEVLEEAGQQFKRQVYKQAMEGADEELLKGRMATPSLSQEVRRGKKAYRFKTKFGEVTVARNRVSERSGKTEIPSHHCWGTPRQICITAGLRAAVCDLVVKQSISSTLVEIEKRTAWPAILSSSSCLNILHAEGEALIAAQEARARAVFEAIPAAKSLIVASNKKWRKQEQFVTYDYGYGDEEAAIIGERVIWSWERVGNEEGEIRYYEKAQRTQAEGLVIVQLDEVKVVAQPESGRKEIRIYTGVVNANERSYYFSAESGAKLFYQVGSLLAVLGVHKGEREIYIIGDGARWIRNWYKDLPVGRKSMALCWYHLIDSCHQLLISSLGKELSFQVENKLLSKLWRGDVSGALCELAINKERVINIVAFRKLQRYLQARRPFITNYEMRRFDEQWIASTRVEKFNDWSVASRCKGQGRTWGAAGVKAIAALVATERNGELANWRREGKLPGWEQTGSLS
jgi:hypothetical protein